MIRPLWDQVVVERAEAVGVSAGGIFIPSNAQEKSTEGIVRAVGAGRLMASGTIVELAVKPGDKVIMAKHAFTEVKSDGKDYIIVREDAILAVID